MLALLGFLLALGHSASLAAACPTLFLSSNGSGVLSSSQGYPRFCGVEYCHNLNCNYELVSGRQNGGHGVEVRFDYFLTEFGHDFAELVYTDAQGYIVTGKLSGNMRSFTERLPARQGTPVRLRWVTDSTVNTYGFLMRFQPLAAPPSRWYRVDGLLEANNAGVRGEIRVDRVSKK